MKTAKKVMITEFGAPETMKLESVTLPDPAAGEVQLKQTAIGLNFIDIYQRKGVYPIPLPTGLGHEAAGVVEAVGPDVTAFKPGDRVAYMNAGLGAYADYRNVPADRLVAIPSTVSEEEAAALLFKGMTAQYLLKKTHQVKPGEIVLVHAAAGGVGHFSVQVAKLKGAHVVAVASTRHEAFLRDLGADEFIDYKKTPPEDVARDLDLVVDTLGGPATSRFLRTLKRFVTEGVLPQGPSEKMAKAHRDLAVVRESEEA